MKLTKQQLKELIKEEIGTLQEANAARLPYENLVNTLGEILQHYLESVGMHPDEIKYAAEEALEWNPWGVKYP